MTFFDWVSLWYKRRKIKENSKTLAAGEAFLRRHKQPPIGWDQTRYEQLQRQEKEVDEYRLRKGVIPKNILLALKASAIPERSFRFTLKQIREEGRRQIAFAIRMEKYLDKVEEIATRKGVRG